MNALSMVQLTIPELLVVVLLSCLAWWIGRFVTMYEDPGNRLRWPRWIRVHALREGYAKLVCSVLLLGVLWALYLESTAAEPHRRQEQDLFGMLSALLLLRQWVQIYSTSYANAHARWAAEDAVYDRLQDAEDAKAR